MIEDIKQDTEERMGKALEALSHNFNKIRTGRAHPSLLDSIRIEYYGAETPLNQLANINIEDARTLSVVAFDKGITPDIERAILKSDLGLNPATAGDVIRIPMPVLTEETRKGYIKQARAEAESARGPAPPTSPRTRPTRRPGRRPCPSWIPSRPLSSPRLRGCRRRRRSRRRRRKKAARRRRLSEPRCPSPSGRP